MSQDKIKETEAPALGRRRFLNTAAIASIGTLVACNEKPGTAGAIPSASASAGGGSHASSNAPHLKPGELDTYYGLWSGGHTGDMRVL